MTKSGYTVHPQVGSGGFFIDLAVVDDAHPGRYLLGIECDGATYHSAKSARDRDRIRQQVLEGLGWKIHRIWSTDWFRNSDRELKRVIESIENERSDGGTSGPPIPQAEGSGLERAEFDPPEIESLAIPYETAELLIALPYGHELHEVHPSQIGEWVERVVLAESPVHVAEVARRITRAVGLKRVGRRILGAVGEGANSAVSKRGIRKTGKFLWRLDHTDPPVRDRSNLPIGSRKIELVDPAEIQKALLSAVERSFGIHPGEAIVEVSRLLGFKRATKGIETRIEKQLHGLLKEGKLRLDADILQLGASVVEKPSSRSTDDFRPAGDGVAKALSQAERPPDSGPIGEKEIDQRWLDFLARYGRVDNKETQRLCKSLAPEQKNYLVEIARGRYSE